MTIGHIRLIFFLTVFILFLNKYLQQKNEARQNIKRNRLNNKRQ